MQCKLHEIRKEVKKTFKNSYHKQLIIASYSSVYMTGRQRKNLFSISAVSKL
jgi:hypothetical protein